ncbi:MAG: GEVED domain-containing protein [Bacteroidia bacterium]|nr:GEVED domain-containing protein [Bacteroidia bacterium]
MIKQITKLMTVCLVALMLWATGAQAQSTIVSTLANNNGSSVVVFSIQNNNSYDINILDVASCAGVTGTHSAFLYAKPATYGVAPGPPGAISLANGWTVAGSNTNLPLTANASGTGLAATSFFNQSLSYTVPAMSHVRFCLQHVSTANAVAFTSSGGSLRYSTVSGSATFTVDNVSLICESNYGYGGTITSPTNHPRGLVGYVVFDVAGPPPSCLPPTQPVGNATSQTTANLSWSGIFPPPAVGYEYAVQTSNTPPASGTPTTGTSASVTGLTPNTTYYLFVRTDCGGGDYSTWRSDMFYTGYCAVTNSNSGTYGISNFTTTGGLLNVNKSSTGSAYSDYTYLTVMQSVGASVNFSITSYYSTAGMAIWVDWNGNLEFEASERVYNAGTYVSVGTGSFTVPLGTANGQYRMRVVANYLSSTPTACGDLGYDGYGEAEDYTFEVGTLSCMPPTNPIATPTSVSTADLSWSGIFPPPAVGYEYAVITSPLPPAIGTPTTSTSVSVSGLLPSTNYYMYVRTDCGSGNYSPWVSTPFTTPTPGQIGQVNSNYPYLPIYSYYGYNYSQQIYLASECNAALGAGNIYITKLRFYYAVATSPTNTWDVWTVYLGHTNKSSFSNTTDWVAYSALQEVWTGQLTLPPAGNWVEITFSTPFVWDGVSNIVIAVDENVPSYTGTAQWGVFTANANRGMMFYSDGTNPNPASPPAANVGPVATINTIQLVASTPPSCLPPTSILADASSQTTANLSWTASNSNPSGGYEWEVRTSGAGGSGPVGLTASGSTAAGVLTASVSGLTANTTYYTYVRSNCGSGNYSSWASAASFYTGYCAILPGNYGYGISGFSTTGGYTNINNSSTVSSNCYEDYSYLSVMQSPGGSIGYTITNANNSYNYMGIWVDWNGNMDFEPSEQVYNSVSSYQSATGSFTIPMATPDGYYRMRVVSNAISSVTPCDNLGYAQYGEAEDYTVNVATPTCMPPTNPIATPTSVSTADISWSGIFPPPAVGYEYAVITSPLPPASGTPTTSTSVSVSGLLPSTNYYMYVRTDCGSGNYSPWIAMAFTTPTPGQIGDNATTNSYFPIYTCYTNNYSQQIYLASECNAALGAGNTYITKIRFYYQAAAASPSSFNNWRVFMGNTSKSVFSNTSDWVAYSNLTEVYNGVVTIPAAGNWMEITFATNFIWDGFSNIVVAVKEEVAGYSCTANWGAFNSGSNRGIMYYSDGVNPDPVSPPAANVGPVANINTIQLVAGTPPSCLPPTSILADALSQTTANLSWTASNSNPSGGYEWEVRTSGAGGSGPVGLTASGSTAAGVLTASVSGLTASTTYYTYVRSNCGSGNYSPWASAASFYTNYCLVTNTSTSYGISNFTTTGGYTNINNSSGVQPYSDFSYLSVTQSPGQPVNFTISINAGTQGLAMWIDWNNNLVFDASEKVYASNTYVSSGSGSFTVPLGQPDGYYRMRIVGNYLSVSPTACDNLGYADYGEAEDYTVNVMTPNCMPPTAPTGTATGLTTATVSWTAPFPAPAMGYEYAVITSPLPPVSGTLTSNTTENITGLTNSTTYYLHVRSVCGTGNESPWVTASFATPIPGQIGDNATTNSYFPIYTCYTNNYSQQIYLASECNAALGAGNTYITKIRFYYQAAAASPSSFNNWRVFMGNTSKSVFSNTSDWVAYSNLTEVYNGVVTIPAAGNWMEITFATNFIWDGFSNIVVAVKEEVAGYSCTANWGAFNSGSNRGIMYYSDGVNPDPVSPPAANVGPVANINTVQFVTAPLSPCSGTPVPGNTLSSAEPACANANFTLNIQNPILASGIDYQWQSADDAAFTTNLVNLGTNAFQITNQSSDKYYRCIVTCTYSGQSAISTPLLVTTNQNACQCISYCAATNMGGACITNVTFNTINNTTTCAAAPDYYSMESATTSLIKGSAYTFSVSCDAAAITSVWFDWNGDGTFSPSEWFQPYTNAASGSVSVTVPISAVSGSIRMRVRSRLSGNTNGDGDACLAMGSGETEDYCITLIDPTPCSGTPAASTTQASSVNVCPSATVNLSLSPPYLNIGINYQWQASTNGGSTWTNFGSNSSDQTVTPTASTMYQCIITCTNSGQSVTSTPVSVTVMGTLMCSYCNPIMYPSNPCNYISSVSTTGGITNFTNTTNTYNGTGATFFPGMVVSQMAGSAFSLTATANGTCNIAYYYIWIDYDQNGVFDSYELVNDGTGINSGNTPTTFNFTIPVAATTGLTRIRVFARGIDTPLPATACEDETAYYGEVEDYVLDILPAGPCSGTPTPGNTQSTLTDACTGILFGLYLQNGTPGTGVTYQWQSSTNGGSTWTNFGSSSPTQSVSQTVSTMYRCIVTCSGQSGTSTPVQVNMADECVCGGYCTPIGNCTDDDMITNVSFGTINNTTTCDNMGNGYTLFTSPNPLFVQGQSYALSVTAGTTWAEGVAVWIDYNHNGVFEASELVLNGYTGNAPQTYSTNVTIPLNATGGTTRMRVRCAYATDPANNSDPSCIQVSYGETEDYCIMIGDPNCIAVPTAPANNSAICPEMTGIELSWPAKSGATGYNVYLDNVDGTTLVSANQSGTSYNAGNLGVDTYFWKVVPQFNSGTCSTPVVWSFGVNPAPSPTAITNAPVCEGEVLNLGTDTYNSYQWSGPNGFTSTDQYPVVTSSAQASHSGTYTVTVTNSFLCTGTDTVSVVVNPRPVPYIINQTNVSCYGGNDGSVTIGSSGLAPYVFDWTFGLDYADSTTISNLSAQTFSVTVYDGNGCQSDPDLQVTITEPTQLSASAGSNSPINSGQTLMLTSSVSGGTPGYSYSWTGPNGFTDNSANPSISNAPVAATGTYYVVVTDANGCTLSASVSVTVTMASTANISGGGPLCLGNSGVVTLTFTGTPPWSGTVSDGINSVNFGPTNNTTENVSVTPVTGGTRTYTITAFTDPNGPGISSGSAVFIVSTAPPLTSAKMPVVPVSACSGTITLVTTQLISGQNIEYSWNTGSSSSVVLFSTSNGGPWSPGPFKTTTNQVYVQFGALGTGMSGYNICVQGQNGCGVTNNKCEFVRGTATVPAGITGSSVQCSGAVNQTYSIPVPLPDGVETYVWSFSVPGAVITPINPPLNSQVNIDFPAFTTGILSVQSGLFCLGSSLSAPRNLVISNAPATPAVPTGPVKVCPGQTYTYSVPPIFGATTYNWTIPANATQVGGGTTKTIQVKYNATPINFSGQILSVSTTSICGATSGTRSKTIASLVPATPGIMSGPLTSACNGPFTYSVTPVSGVTYNWTWPIGVTNNTPNGFNSINLQFPNNFTTGQVSVTGTAAGCAISSNARTVNVKGVPATPGSITAVNPPCAYQPGDFTTSPVTGATGYNWQISPNNGTTIDNGQGTNSIDVTWGAGTATVIVTALNGCGQSGSRTLSYTPGCRLSGEPAVESDLTSLTVYPNPANNHVTVAFNAAESGKYVINLMDVTGRGVAATVVNAQAGINAVEFNLDTYAKGMYMIELRSGNSVEKTKLVIE